VIIDATGKKTPFGEFDPKKKCDPLEIAGVTIAENALDELAQIMSGFMKDAADKKDAWNDFVEALTEFAKPGTELSEDEAKEFLQKLDAWDGTNGEDGEDGQLDDGERNAWQTAGWKTNPTQ